MTSVPEITRMIARIEDWKGQGQARGRAEAARRLDEAHELLDEVANMLTDMRRTILGGGRRWNTSELNQRQTEQAEGDMNDNPHVLIAGAGIGRPPAFLPPSRARAYARVGNGRSPGNQAAGS